MKLEIKHLAPYLPYKLNLYDPINKSTYDSCLNGEIVDYLILGIDYVKLILRPLSDYSDINSQTMIDLNCDLQKQIEIYNLSNNLCGYWNCSYQTINIMAQNHIDFQGLISQGLAVDINTIEK